MLRFTQHDYQFGAQPGLIFVHLLVALFFLSACSSGGKMATFDTEGNEIHQRILESAVRWDKVGTSVEGREVFAKVFGAGEKTVLIIGGFHGNELNGVELALAFGEYLEEEGDVPAGVRAVVVPVLNPDALVRQQRMNVNNVDINRNFPTVNWTPEVKVERYNPGKAPASEPETRIAMKLVEEYRPLRIISIHTPLEVVNYDGPAKELAERMAAHNGYPVRGDIGYPTPGSFGNFAGVEKQIPTITLELPSGPFSTMWEDNKAALIAALSF